jgi:hypothetical protein
MISLSMLSVFTARHKIMHSKADQRPKSCSFLRDMGVSTADDGEKAMLQASTNFSFDPAVNNVALHPG